MSDKDDIFDMEFGEELPQPSPPRLQRMRSTSLSVTLHHSKSMLKAKELEKKSRELESVASRKALTPKELSEEEEEEDPEEQDEAQLNNENLAGAFVPTRNYNNVKLKYFQALNISNRSAPIEAAPRKDPNEAFSKPILSAPSHSTPIPIAANHFVRYETTGQTVNTFVPPHEMAQRGQGTSTVAFWDRPKKNFNAI